MQFGGGKRLGSVCTQSVVPWGGGEGEGSLFITKDCHTLGSTHTDLGTPEIRPETGMSLCISLHSSMIA